MRDGASKTFVVCVLFLAVNAVAQQQQSLLPEPAPRALHTVGRQEAYNSASTCIQPIYVCLL
jgi:hypothetical protein